MIDLNHTQGTNTEIVFEPPEVHYLIDVDSAEEDNADLNHLSGNHLRAPALSIGYQLKIISLVIHKMKFLALHFLQLKSLELPKQKR